MKSDIEILRETKQLLVSGHNKGKSEGYDTAHGGYGVCLANAITLSVKDNYSMLRRLLDLIGKRNADVIDARLKEPHSGNTAWMARAYKAIRYNNHSATTDEDLQRLLDNTISSLQEEARYASLPVPTPAMSEEPAYVEAY